MTNSSTEALAALQQLEENGNLKDRLAIIRISEPISTEVGGSYPSPSKRTSDVSVSNFDDPTPASLEADLAHYKELFSKLRFSYLEQVTKEKFLRAIVGDPPMVVGHNENMELETQLADVKAQLKAQKEDARIMIEEMELMGRDLASRYKNVELQTTQLSTLPASIENLESTIAELRAKQIATMDPSDTNTSSSQNLPLPATLALLAEREAELAALNRQLAAVHNTLPRKTREAEAVERECSVLERRKSDAIAQAREAQRKKQQGESDGLEEMGRWYRGAEETLKELVGTQA
ncbi:hypothetical protein DTO013E5_1886 [Penicillium roqueforti]|uniref:Genomic scaffold, ProqFM164S02 n=1 Tax=Penicillium roqueforti (strain FM164) TaxID=1365484 RepID=W6Q7C3_PENRF|nr:uncharacterized protein LCP9604111_153 [Penicillium roqueforti]CDM31876.1 unnamed protein product [Penicillium roqueforti FM164]KAF9252627.1 hypothetical protein LCP9604111_153 [Penicillium roqueforti]KAI1835687.1 hypothetical protein CBS147337_3710 [Penicillium roqueforti]KAI2675462.1 hypothetical protein CBS147355_6456 [Penicillium roqueforti]KAI2687077.1 hypothetical protein LCP963914a_3678 [Penicillium roqueforti]